eukprot:SAG11_NODE_36170_length_263_cov_0.621951_1_plen_28_part_10
MALVAAMQPPAQGVPFVRHVAAPPDGLD